MTVEVASVGVGKFGKRPESLVELAAEAAGKALEGVGRKTVDLLVLGTMLGHGPQGPEALLPRIASRLGVESAAGFKVDGTSASGAMAFHLAANAVGSGRYTRALVVAAEKMTDVPTATMTGELTGALHASEIAAGASMPGLAALVTQRYLQRYRLDPAGIDRVSVHAREGAAKNPDASFARPVSANEVSESRPIALPLRLLHCSAIADGAVAVVVDRGDGPASVLGLGQAFDALRLVDRADLTTFQATRSAARQAYDASRLTRKEVRLLEIHDAFAPFAFLDLEDLGVCGPGEAPGWFERGWVRGDGRVPVNPGGGLLGRGHPVGASGLAGIAEVASQLRGEAGARAVSKLPKVGLAQSLGGMGGQAFVTILGASGR